MEIDLLAWLRTASLLPERVEPYVALMLLGFVIAIWGHMAKLWLAVAVGIAMIFVATFLFPLALNVFSDRPESPPGPMAPLP